MKRYALPVLILVLCTALLSVACTRVVPTDGGDTNDPETSDITETKAPSNPLSILGKWYSSRNAQVMQFFGDGTLKIFNLAPGYYEYKTITDGTYTYDGTNLSYTLSDGETSETVGCTIGETQLSISISGSTLQYVSTDTLPQAHPEAVFPDYEALAEKYQLPEITLTGNTVQTNLQAEVLSEIQQSYWSAKSKEKWIKQNEGTAKKWDYVNIDYTGYLNGEPFQGGTGTGVDLVVSDNGKFIPGFAEGVIGHAVGEEFDVELVFPENYHETFAGKAVTFHMTLNCIYDMTVTDEMAAEIGYESMEKWLETEYREHLAEEIWDLIPGLSDAEIPLEAYQFFVQINLDRFHEMAFSYGYDYEQFLTKIGLSEKEITEQCKEFGRIYLQAAQIIKQCNLTPSEELIAKITEEFIESYMQNGYSREEAEKIMETDAKNDFHVTLFTELAANYLIENNSFVPETNA